MTAWRFIAAIATAIAVARAQSNASAPPAGPLPPIVTYQPENILQVGFYTWTKYLTYTGALRVKGTIVNLVTPSASAGTTFTYSLKGVDGSCAAGPGTAANSCGLHIHTGTSCTASAGGHYFTGAVHSDPWTSISYTSSLDAATAQFVTTGAVFVQTGAIQSQLAGKVVIVHDYSGAKMSCAVLAPTPKTILYADGFVPYLSYVGDNLVSGTVGPIETTYIVHDDVNATMYMPDVVTGQQAFSWNLANVDGQCYAGPAPGVPNSCGIHFHSGTSCVQPAGGHYYLSPVDSDPWLNVTYTSRLIEDLTTTIPYSYGTWDFYNMVEGWISDGYVNVVTGSSAADLAGHLLIVHNYAGAKIACAVIQVGDPYDDSNPLLDAELADFEWSDTTIASVVIGIFLFFIALGILVVRATSAASDPRLLTGSPPPSLESGVQLSRAPVYTGAGGGDGPRSNKV